VARAAWQLLLRLLCHRFHLPAVLASRPWQAQLLLFQRRA
jgi:hypothetical protein